MHRLDPEMLPRHVDRLYRAAWALCGNRADAEDLVQETFVRVLAKPRFVRESDLAYLMRGLKNAFLDRRRAATARPREVALDDVTEPAAPGGAGQPGAFPESGELFAAVHALPEEFRVVLIAIDVIGLSYAEAAKLTGARQSTVATRLHRARAKVVEMLAETSGGPVASIRVEAAEHE